ncbi:MAG: HD domain-containing protein [Pseudomonadota bacterium]
MSIAEKFAPYQHLVADLMPYAIGNASDASHDVSHVLRVWGNVQKISDTEGGDREILVVTTFLHDCVDVPKESPARGQASRLAAKKAVRLLAGYGWAKERAALVGHAIEAHSFSARIEPETVEAKILQDADRLDAIGYIGIARCFYVSGRLGRALYDPEDPDASDRELNDLNFAVDHFKTKLLQLSGSFQTETGKALAIARHGVVEEFLNGLLAEVSTQNRRRFW